LREVHPLISMFLKLGLASLITGAVLQALDLNALTLLEKVGVTPQAAMELAQRGVYWALPNIVLGSMIIVPAWVVIYLLRPPGERK
jgi:hypothetical protein